MAWGDPSVVRQRLGEAVHELRFERGVALAPALSPRHVLGFLEATFGPLTKLLAGLAPHADRAATVRAEVLEIVAESFEGNVLRQHFLMSCARKRG